MGNLCSQLQVSDPETYQVKPKSTTCCMSKTRDHAPLRKLIDLGLIIVRVGASSWCGDAGTCQIQRILRQQSYQTEQCKPRLHAHARMALPLCLVNHTQYARVAPSRERGLYGFCSRFQCLDICMFLAAFNTCAVRALLPDM